MSVPRRARVRALAKVNLDLRVLGHRPDRYHELRTLFQTISLGDTLDIAFTPGPETAIALTGGPEIVDNLIVRAAQAVLDCLRVSGRVEFRLRKIIPMGAGLGGGSSDAAAVLLALPVLAGVRFEPAARLRLAAQLGSDVPFFLLGGAAVGLGRGTELYPLPDAAPRPGLLVAPQLHVSTADAYRALDPRLTTESEENTIVSFQSQAWDMASGIAVGESGAAGCGVNDFERVVFEQYPQLAALKRRLLDSGARFALMTGSGSAVFGWFATRADAERASESLGEQRVFPISLVSRARYWSMWWRWLGPHLDTKLWPPQSRYAQ